MGYEVNFDKESSSIFISKYADCEWFTPSSITYDGKKLDNCIIILIISFLSLLILSFIAIFY